MSHGSPLIILSKFHFNGKAVTAREGDPAVSCCWQLSPLNSKQKRHDTHTHKAAKRKTFCKKYWWKERKVLQFSGGSYSILTPEKTLEDWLYSGFQCECCAQGAGLPQARGEWRAGWPIRIEESGGMGGKWGKVGGHVFWTGDVDKKCLATSQKVIKVRVKWWAIKCQVSARW